MFKKYRTLVLLLVLFISSCGTILYPERRGQYLDSKKIDFSVVLLNASSALVFPPLAIAFFVVDVKDNTIFLPTDEVLTYDNTPENAKAKKEQRKILKKQEKEKRKLAKQQGKTTEEVITEDTEPEEITENDNPFE